MLNKYYYKRAYARYDETDMSEKDRRFCAAVEELTLIGRDRIQDAVQISLLSIGIMSTVPFLVGKAIWDETKRSYEQYEKENL